MYSFVLQYSMDTQKIEMSAPMPTYYTNITLLGYDGVINWIGNFDKGGVVIDVSTINWAKYTNKLAMAFRLTNLA